MCSLTRENFAIMFGTSMGASHVAGLAVGTHFSAHAIGVAASQQLN